MFAYSDHSETYIFQFYIYNKEEGTFYELSMKFGKATAGIESELLPVNERSTKKERENEMLQEQLKIQHETIRSVS